MLIWWRSRSTWHRGGKMHTYEVRVRMRMFYWWEAQTRSGWQSQASKCTTGYRRTILIITSFPFYNCSEGARRLGQVSPQAKRLWRFHSGRLFLVVCAHPFWPARQHRECATAALWRMLSHYSQVIHHGHGPQRRSTSYPRTLALSFVLKAWRRPAAATTAA